MPVALAGGVDPERALGTWGAFTLGTAAATGAVRAVIDHLKRPATAAQRVAVPAVVWLDARAVVALVPMLEVAVVVALLAPHPRHLKRVGFSLLGASAMTAVLLCL